MSRREEELSVAWRAFVATVRAERWHILTGMLLMYLVILAIIMVASL